MDIAYLKSVMEKEGLLAAPSPGETWAEPEEQAWRHVCAKLGLNYTPYPTRINQDPYWLDIIDKKELTFHRVTQPATVFNPEDFLPGPLKFHPETPTHILKKMKPLDHVPAKFMPNRGEDIVERAQQPVLKRKTQRASPRRSQQINEALEKSNVDPTKAIRVR